MCLVPEREKNPRKSAMPFVKCSYWKELYTERKLRLHTLGAVNSFCTAQGVDTEKGCKVFPFTCMVFPRVTALPRLVYFLVDCSPMPPWPSAATFTHLISQEKDRCLCKGYKKYSSMKIHTLHLNRRGRICHNLQDRYSLYRYT